MRWLDYAAAGPWIRPAVLAESSPGCELHSVLLMILHDHSLTHRRQLRLVDDDFKDVPIGVTGEALIKGPTIFMLAPKTRQRAMGTG